MNILTRYYVTDMLNRTNYTSSPLLKPSWLIERWLLRNLFHRIGQPDIRLCLWNDVCQGTAVPEQSALLIRSRLEAIYRARRHLHNSVAHTRHKHRAQYRGLIHNIAQNQADPTSPWIKKYIFPDGYSPTLREMMAIFEPFDLSITDVENLRLHYALTQ